MDMIMVESWLDTSSATVKTKREHVQHFQLNVERGILELIISQCRMCICNWAQESDETIPKFLQ